MYSGVNKGVKGEGSIVGTFIKKKPLTTSSKSDSL